MSIRSWKMLQKVLKPANYELLRLHHSKFQIPTVWVLKTSSAKKYLFGHENGVRAPSNVCFWALLLLNFNFVVIWSEWASKVVLDRLLNFAVLSFLLFSEHNFWRLRGDLTWRGDWANRLIVFSNYFGPVQVEEFGLWVAHIWVGPKVG